MSDICRPRLRELLIVGAGGSGREIAWLARDIHGADLRIIFAVEPKYLSEAKVDDITVIALDDAPRTNIHDYVVAIGDLKERRRLTAICEGLRMRPATLVHPSVLHSERVEFGDGTVVCAGAIVTTNIRIGRHVHINIGCTVSHDVILGDFSTLSPGVHISGHVHVEDDVFLGTGASVINGTAGKPLVIERGAIVAAGACVTRPVQPGTMVAGVPAIQKR